MKSILLRYLLGIALLGAVSLAFAVDKAFKSPSAIAARSHGLLSTEVVIIAKKVNQCAKQAGIYSGNFFTFIDMDLASTKKRLWIVDTSTMKVLYHGLVAHGKGSGADMAHKFSNTNDSYETSIGLYKTGKPYVGSDGYSMRLHGLEPGFNSNAYSRAIVMHGASYVSENFIKQYGRLGRSWGCPAVSKSVIKQIVNTIDDGSLLFIYYPSDKWFKESKFYNCDLKGEEG